MPTADGRIKGISLAGLRIPWLEQDADELAEEICPEPVAVCHESQCIRYGGTEPCHCDKPGEIAEPGW